MLEHVEKTVLFLVGAAPLATPDLESAEALGRAKVAGAEEDAAKQALEAAVEAAKEAEKVHHVLLSSEAQELLALREQLARAEAQRDAALATRGASLSGSSSQCHSDLRSGSACRCQAPSAGLVYRKTVRTAKQVAVPDEAVLFCYQFEHSSASQTGCLCRYT